MGVVGVDGVADGVAGNETVGAGGDGTGDKVGIGITSSS